MTSRNFRRAGALAAVFLFVCGGSSGFAAFQNGYSSARVTALAGAFTAVADDPSLMFYNVAAASKLRSRQTNFSYARLFAGFSEVKLSVSQFAYAQSLGRSMGFGVGWESLNTSDVYREDTVVAGYAQDLKSLLGDLNGDLSVGVSVRYLTRQFVLDGRTTSDPVFSRGSRIHAATFDLHIYAVPERDLLPGLSLGLSVKSLNQTEIGFLDGEKLPREITGGLLYRWKSLDFPIDVSHRAGVTLPHFGTEYRLRNDTLTLRLGSDTVQAGTGFGYRYELSRKISVVFDYGFLWPLQVEKSAGSHQGTLGIKF